MPRARALPVALVAASAIGAALTLAVVFLAGGFDREQAASPVANVAPIADTHGGLNAQAIYAAHVKGVVTVYVDTGKTGVLASGSGFVADATRGLVITNSHVVTSSAEATTPDQVQVYAPIFIQGADQARTPATVLGYDLFDDIAVLRYDPTRLPLPAVPFGESSSVRVGDPIAVIGAPFGLAESFAVGVVSQIGTQIVAPAAVCFRTIGAIQIAAPINRGNSGGPLFDAAGKVVGVVSQAELSSTDSTGAGIAFAVPIDAAKRSLDEITATRHVRYAWLGVGGATLTPDIVSAYALRPKSGVLVSFVEAKSGAAKAGISTGGDTAALDGRIVNEKGDVIVSFDHRTIRTLGDLQRAVATKRPGDTVKVGWWHGTTHHEASIVLGERNLRDPAVCRASAAP
jgi:S1-C subfamily serine protease